MPLLDVSDIVLDPMFASKFQIIRSEQFINDDGIAYTSQSFLQAYGTITEGAPDQFLRQTGYEVSKDTVYIVTQTLLYTVDNIGGTQYQPDIVVVNGEKYTVMKVKDYSAFGKGFNSAICEIYDVAGKPQSI